MDFLVHLQRQAAALDQQCRRQARQVAGAKTLQAAVRLAEISIRPELRALRHGLPGLRLLRQTVEQRLKELLDALLKDLAAQPTLEAAKDFYGRLMARECHHLRGEYAQLYRFVEREGQRILHKKEKEENNENRHS